MVNWFTKNLKKKKFRLEFKRALRQQQYVDQQNVAFLIWKLAVTSPITIPRYRAWVWRSWYKNQLYKQYQRKGFLLNLYFLYSNFKPNSNQRILGHTSGNQSYWLLNYSYSLDKHFHLYNFLYKHLVEYKKLSLDKFDKSWQLFRAADWVAIPVRGHFVPLEFEDSALEQYWLVEKQAHYFQYKIICDFNYKTGALLNLSQFHPWILKTLLLRTIRYPSILQYKYLKLLSGLQYFGYIVPIPWWRTLQEDGVWQADPIAVHLFSLIPYITYIYRRSEITEYLLKKMWQDFLTCDDIVSDLVKIAMPIDPRAFVQIVLRSLRITNLK